MIAESATVMPSSQLDFVLMDGIFTDPRANEAVVPEKVMTETLQQPI